MNTQPNVKSFSATDSQGNPLRISVSTDIVDYMDSARTFGRQDLAHANAHSRFQRRLIAIPDRKNGVVTPMVLSIGSNDGLYLVRKEDGAAGDGWTLTDLGQSFATAVGGTAHVRAVGAAWTDDDRITVAVAVDGGDSTAPSRVFAAFDLTSQSDWSSIAWTDCGTRESVRVSGIRVLDEGDGQWTVVLDGSGGRVDMLYLLRSTARQFDQANVFNPPVDYQEVFDFDVAIDPFVGSGVVLLGQSGRTRVLSFRPFPRYTEDGRVVAPPGVVPLPCPAGANVLATGLTRNGGTDLYVGGQGVHTITADDFDNRARATLIPVMSADAAPDVQQLCVADAADGSVAAYALLQNGNLVVARRGAASEADAGWRTPLRIRKDVQDVAPVHGDQHARTSLLIVRTDGTAAVLLQDAGTGVWRESPLLVSNPNEVSAVSCFGTTLRLVAPDALPRTSTPVKVSASVLTSVVLNNRNVFIGPGIDAETQTDANGSVCLYDRARSLTPAVYRFTFDGLTQSIDVNPAGGVHERFRTMTGGDLRTATVTVAPGRTEPLLSEEFRTGERRNQVDGMATALNQVAALATRTTTGPIPGVTQTRGDAAFSSTLNPGAMSDGYQWAIQADANGIRPAPQQQVDSIVSASTSIEHFFTDLGETLADFFEGLWERIKEGWTFVVRKVQDAVEFICALGDKIKKFVLSTLEEIGSFFTWLWDQVKAGLEKVWNYLKFVFDWDDILVARDVMVKAADEALAYLKDSTGMLKDKAREGFDYAIAEVQRWETELGVVPERLPPPPPGTSVAAQVSQAGTPAQNILDQSTGNSIVGWVMQRLDSVMDEIVLFEGPSPGQVAVSAAKDFVTGLVDDELENLRVAWVELQAEVARIFDHKMPSGDLLSFDTLKRLFVAVGAKAVVTLLRMLRDIVLRAIDLLGGLIDVMHSLLFSKVRFPFVEKLVELIAPGTNLDTSFRLVDALMLLASIPATITYKLIFNEAPFTKGQQVAFSFGRVAAQSTAMETFKTFAGIAAAFVKLAKGTYATANAMIGDFDVTKVSIIGGAVFAAVGLIAQIVGRYEQEGDTVAALEWAAIAAGALATVVTFGTVFSRWNNPIAAVVPTSHKVDAWADLLSNVAQIGLSAAVFGVIIDRLRKSSVRYDQVRQLPESYKWTSGTFDSVGTVLTDIATIVPIEQPEVKLALIGIGAATKSGHLTFKILEVITTKYALEPLRA